MRNAIQYDGPCLFLGERGGTFSLTFPRDAGDLTVRGVNRIRVRVMRPGVAEIGESDGRWGRAQRSRRDGACWEAREFQVCAY